MGRNRVMRVFKAIAPEVQRKDHTRVNRKTLDIVPPSVLLLHGVPLLETGYPALVVPARGEQNLEHRNE
jgi:hypothetical protein